jgi:cytidylate kinase
MDRLGHIAIDGPAGSGKTTVARALAGRLQLLYLDTGSMYRAVAFLALNAGCDPADAASVLKLVTAHPIRAVHDATSADGFRIFAGDRALGDDLYGPDISRIVSIVAAQPAIRERMVELQRAVASESPVVMAGRDIGTVVLPSAALKVFLTASLAERVDRRLAELAAAGIAIEHATLEREMRERDRLDENRAIAPLRPAPDAVVIDSTGIAVESVVERIASLARAVCP